MPCKLELVLQAILPFVASNFDVYSVATGSSEYGKVVLSAPSVCESSRLIIANRPGLKAFETERPINDLHSRLSAVPGIEMLKFVSRKGPFYGYYLQVRPLPGDRP